LTIDTAGDLLGTTATGGADGFGEVFEIANTGAGYAASPTVLTSLTGANGSYSQAGLIMDATGDLFGATSHGGTGDAGDVFELTWTRSGYAGAPIVLANFDYTIGSPTSGLVMDSAGNLFGVIADNPGGGNPYGAVFEIAKTASGYASAPSLLVGFDGANGKDVNGPLVTDANGDLFGTTDQGGASNEGEVFEIAKSGTGYANAPTVLASFTGGNSQYPGPASGLITDAAGDLFGTTAAGGAYGFGEVFEIVKSGAGFASTPTVLTSFDGANGYYATNGLIMDAAGNLFGILNEGGPTEHGDVFEILHGATGYADAPIVVAGLDSGNVEGSLTADAAGNLFGAEFTGGANGDGEVFEVTGSGFETRVPFDASAPDDFTGSGISGLLWQNQSSGAAYEWSFSNYQHVSGADVPLGYLAGWSVVGSGDFTGNGTGDVIWQNQASGGTYADGATYEWLMTDGQHTGDVYLGNLSGWAPTVGKFDGDGAAADIVWQNQATGDAWEWTMSNGQDVANTYLGTLQGWDIVASGDFTGNGTDDVIWQNQASGATYEWLMTNGQHDPATDVFLGNLPGWNFVGSGDFTGDGTSDLIWQNASSGATYEWLMSNGQHDPATDVFLGDLSGWSLVGTGDYSGNGTDGMIWQNQASGAAYEWTMSNGQHVAGADVSLGALPGWQAK
jgi:uncharacterized repeat protein (TIGR03803 family)